MEVRSLISCPARAVVKCGQKHLIRHSSATRKSSIPLPTPINYPLCLRRDLSHSLPSPSQAAAAAQSSSDEQSSNEEQQQPQQRQPRRASGTGLRLDDHKLDYFNEILDVLGYAKRPPSDPNEIDKSVSKEFQQRTSASMQSIKPYRASYARDLMNRNLSAATAETDLNLGPRLGRSITVRSQALLKESLSILGRRVAQNKVKQDSLNQKFHVRRGKMKKDLKSQRWRRLFKKSFQTTVGRCERLRRQGW